MMKRVIPLLILSAAQASRLGITNVGVEEIGDQIEFFPEEFPDREVLLARRLQEMADGLVEEEDAESDSQLEKVTVDSSESVIVQNTRREAVTCNDNKAKVTITLNTHAAGYQVSYVLKNSNNQAILNMPEDGSKFGKKQAYSEDICLKPGSYTLRLKDAGANGMCTNGYCGSVQVAVDGTAIMNVDMSKVSSSWSVVDKSFDVTLFSGRNSFSGNGGGSGQTFTGDSGFVSKSCYDVQVYLKIDGYGKETSFKITKAGSSNAVFSDSNSLDKGESKTFDAGCLKAGDYTLTFTDIDGICCKNGDGEFKLIVDGTELLSGGRFIKQISHNFKVGHDWGEGMASRDWEWLLAHNERRKDYHTRCNSRYCNKKYRPLKWSAGLAKDAQAYANALLDTCESTGIKHEPGIEQGENLAKNKGFGDWGRMYPADNIVKRFVDNEARWAWTKNAHLTQALWYPTKYLGCAESVKTMSDGATCRMQVCRYAKAGNCEMGKYDSATWPNHEIPMMMDDSQCGPVCPPEGCYI